MLRIILIFIIVFLIVRVFVIAGSARITDKNAGEPTGDKINKKKGVPRGIGEYVDFEEIKKKS
jgi:hypothetical protein